MKGKEAAHDELCTAVYAVLLYTSSCRLLWYKEPTPEPVGDLEQHLIGKVEVQKLILMAPQASTLPELAGLHLCIIKHILSMFSYIQAETCLLVCTNCVSN